MAYAEITYEVVEGSIAKLTLNRPEKRNPLSPATIGELVAAFEEAKADAAVRAADRWVPRRAGDTRACRTPPGAVGSAHVVTPAATRAGLAAARSRICPTVVRAIIGVR